MRRLLAIVNSAAGGADDEVVSEVLSVLAEHADTVEARVGGPAELPEALAEHPDRDPVVLGGDGTLHRLVEVLAERGELGSRTVGLVPLGTGNDLARALGVPLDPAEAARAAALGEPRPLDLLRDDEGGIVVNAVHLGVGVEAARAAKPLKPVLRRFAYAVGSVIAGVRTKGVPLRVEVDGRVVADGRRRVLMAGIGNGTSIGGGTPLTPDAHLSDGLADVVVSFATSPLQRLLYGVLLRLGRHTRRPEVTTVRGARIRVSGPGLRLNADGELTGPVPARTWTVEARAWRLALDQPRSGTA
ncbi:diacylglycerol/lipid kinase family protein [Nonomuraea gerenzanensis]|uniref:Diacylglycerol kinase, catalytic region n=1 Tax=Nonomuraea gerenzanensis TaxID=93944 RepID=A0A1M4EQS6_9ACTN|nr:diacylglycerol kinase family protein [Nonomuraea gerenzanensis]UBU12612.1 lipid kinase [Nonomuraea gerenzanensis]SBP01167.1 diacylglycerol kinase, catalytic region [Nonomuraea gerenzanensis]